MFKLYLECKSQMFYSISIFSSFMYIYNLKSPIKMIHFVNYVLFVCDIFNKAVSSSHNVASTVRATLSK